MMYYFILVNDTGILGYLYAQVFLSMPVSFTDN